MKTIGGKPQSAIDLFEHATHSFILKIWLEEPTNIDWRGHITQVPSGKRQYVKGVDEFVKLLSHYIQLTSNIVLEKDSGHTETSAMSELTMKEKLGT